MSRVDYRLLLVASWCSFWVCDIFSLLYWLDCLLPGVLVLEGRRKMKRHWHPCLSWVTVNEERIRSREWHQLGDVG